MSVIHQMSRTDALRFLQAHPISHLAIAFFAIQIRMQISYGGAGRFLGNQHLWQKQDMCQQNGRSAMSLGTTPKDPLPTHALRIGEAKNPGPKSPTPQHSEDPLINTFTMVVTNPTAIHQKAQTLHVLEADLLALSETSATATVQAQFSREFAKLGYKSVWGYPAPAQLSAGNQDSLRGAAIGVSMHSKFPIRAARNQPESPWHQAGRFMHTFVQLPGIEIQVCNLYGLPASVATAKQRTNSLLEFAHHCIRHTTFPGIICGDLNHHPDTLDAWTALRSAGYRTAESIFRDLNGRDMPATLGMPPSMTYGLLHPILASMVTAVWVDNQKLLAGHNPLGITFAIPSTSPLKPTWKLPESWIALQPNSMYFQQCYEPMYSDGKTVATVHSHLHPLQVWATKIETAIDAAIAAEHEENPQFQPHKKLPKKHRGRCQDLKITHAQLPRSIKQAPHGQYTPDVDHASIKLRQFTRQIRRLQSLKTRMKKHESQGSTQRILDQLSEEWSCILHARGFGATFWDWLHNMPELQGIPERLPAADYLHQAEQLLKHEAKHMEYEHKTRSTKHAQYLQALDATRFGKRMAYKKIKEPSPGLVSVVEINRTATADVLQQPQFGLMTLSRPSNMHLDATQPLYINTFATTITQLDECTVECMIHDEILELPKQVSIQQIHETAAPSEVADRLTEFWSQYWNRDSPEAQHKQEHWSQFHELKSLVPKLPRFPISLTSLEDWIMAVKALKSSTARGCCGWSADEFKMLSTDCIADLMYICRDLQPHGFPHWLMKSRVVPVAKTLESRTVDSTRPITILSLLYRLWSRVTTRQILKTWTQLLPAPISGFLPNRNPHALVYEMQIELESTNHGLSPHEWGGLTLDLIKCFNTLPQWPIRAMLIHMGLESALVDCWLMSLQRMFRHWHLNGELYPTPCATTGLPEGDAWSVLGMISINYYFCSLLRTVTLKLHAYADNWSYSTTEPTQHKPTIELLQKIATSLALQIDWKKTWAWATSNEHKEALIAATPQHLPDAVQLRQLSHARDLGYVLHYRLLPFRGSKSQTQSCVASTYQA